MVRRRKSGLNFGKRKKKINFTVVKEVLSWTVEIALTLLIAFTFVYFIGLRTSVVGQSMSKTLNGGDQILVNRFVYKVTDPKTNDIIVFLPNGNEKSHYYVKRVIEIPYRLKMERYTSTEKHLMRKRMLDLLKMQDLRRMRSHLDRMNILFWEITVITVRTAVMQILEI